MKRRSVREIAIQSLYQMEMNDVTARDAVAMIIEEAQNDNESLIKLDEGKPLVDYVLEMVNGTYARKMQIDDMLTDYLKGWQMDRLSRVDRQILRLAVYEMIFIEDAPPKVVINEAIDLAKHYGTDDSGKFVNGVLGKMIKELDEIKAKK